MELKLIEHPYQVGLITRDADRMLKFYGEVLGLPVGPTTPLPNGGEMRRVYCGDTIIKLNSPGTPPKEDPPGGVHSDATGIRYMTICVSNAREVYDELVEGGHPIPIPIRESPERVVFFVQDPDGNNIEIFQSNNGAGLFPG